MTKDECYYLGRVTKPFGFKGEMVLFLDVDSPDDYATLDSVFVEMKNGLVPYFIKSLRINGNKAVALFEDLTAEQAAALAEVKGFRVVDDQYGDIGVIESIIEYPAQPLFQIMNGTTEILIPVIDQVIKEVDRDNKTIYISAPNGLIDLYMSENNN